MTAHAMHDIQFQFLLKFQFSAIFLLLLSMYLNFRDTDYFSQTFNSTLIRLQHTWLQQSLSVISNIFVTMTGYVMHAMSKWLHGKNLFCF